MTTDGRRLTIFTAMSPIVISGDPKVKFSVAVAATRPQNRARVGNDRSPDADLIDGTGLAGRSEAGIGRRRPATTIGEEKRRNPFVGVPAGFDV